MVCLNASSKLERVGQIYGRKTSLNLKSVQFENSKCKFHVLFNNVDKIITSDNKDTFEFILFVNSKYWWQQNKVDGDELISKMIPKTDRLVENAKLKREVKEVYKALGSNSKPYFVYITIHVDPNHVDINIHPNKNEVKRSSKLDRQQKKSK